MELTTETRTVEVVYVNILGEDFRLVTALDFVEKVEGSTSFRPMRWQPEYDNIADYLMTLDIIDRTNRGSWYVTDETTIEKLQEELRNAYDETLDLNN